MLNLTFVNTELTATGYWDDNLNKFDINLSSILTKLIQEAGRWCENYASDLFIDWERLQSNLTNKKLRNHTMIFAFRQCGVDGLTEVQIKTDNPIMYGYNNDYYRAVYVLDITINGDSIKCELGRIN